MFSCLFLCVYNVWHLGHFKINAFISQIMVKKNYVT
jgi:hypothetical protein